MKYPLLITIDEMLSLSGFATVSELKLCWKMYEKYFQAKNLNPRVNLSLMLLCILCL